MAGIEGGRPTYQEALQLWRFMEAGEAAKPSWKHETNPHHVFDKTMSRVLRPLMVMQAQGKISHWWHWNNLPEEVNLEEQGGIPLLGNKESHSLSSDLHVMRTVKNVKMSLGGWKEAYIIGPDMEQMDEEQYEEGWRYAFEGRGNDARRQFCSIISHGPIRILAGPDDFIVGGLKPFSMETIPVKTVGPFPHRAELPLI